MLEYINIEAWVQRLLGEIQTASLSLSSLVKARGGIGPDLEGRLDRVHLPLLELAELQVHHRAEIEAIVPEFAAELQDAYRAVHGVGIAIDHRRRPDLDEMTQDLHELMRSLDAAAPADGAPFIQETHKDRQSQGV